MSVPRSFLNAEAYCRSSAPTPTNAVGTLRGRGMSRSQIRSCRVAIGIASIPSRAATASGLVQMHRNSLSGERERIRERIASSVLSFPEFRDPKWPKKLILGDPCVDATKQSSRSGA
jgi:hypothetical protein